MAELNIPASVIEEYLFAIKADYALFSDSQNLEKFDTSYEIGNKYIRIVAKSYGQRSAHSFIVNKPDKKGKFQVGDILKAASWAAPATNFKRGNVLLGDVNVRWTGA